MPKPVADKTEAAVAHFTARLSLCDPGICIFAHSSRSPQRGDYRQPCRGQLVDRKQPDLLALAPRETPREGGNFEVRMLVVRLEESQAEPRHHRKSCSSQTFLASYVVNAKGAGPGLTARKSHRRCADTGTIQAVHNWGAA
jgi:hypothetical protein